MPATPVLAYWDLRGLGERIRIMLQHCGVKYEDKRYSIGSGEWGADKPNLGMGFPNLPYYIDGDVRLSESMAIMKYIARKHNMVPESAEGWGKVEMMEGVVNDFWSGFVKMCYSPDHDTAKYDYIKDLPTSLARFDSYLAKNEWLGGCRLTYLDFYLGECLDFVRLFHQQFDKPNCFADFKNLSHFLEKFENLEAVSEHRKRDEYKPLPCMGPYSKWGG